ncbi:hypothetical protein A2V80_00310 [Candidatus Woesebacteria bacterium RBG_16_39_8b]|uniref:Uncharacterized protein n=1 Tax=Candidatus Woesebacteria bacterium RBG_16_39_8b TaxID=1802482 RepID=A0A1F7X8I9_9BACT|nr:MAG: hypothetical protein A2V80_00310 [Candidatus Woesebacteria bacterium RBG_16_39_8b]
MVLFGIAGFCFLHIVRDYLQLRGVKNWFTEVGHFWNAPKYNVYGMAILSILGLVCLYFAFK